MPSQNKFFTIMVVPEKTQKVKKFILPNYLVRGFVTAIVFLVILAVIMILDYANVMNQITENKRLKIENRQLRQSVQVIKDKVSTMENTLDRIKTFSTKLKIITNIEEPATESNSGLSPLPAPPIIQQQDNNSIPTAPSKKEENKNGVDTSSNNSPVENISSSGIETDTDEDMMLNSSIANDPDSQRAKRKSLIASMMKTTEDPSALTLTDADNSTFVKKEFEKLDTAYEAVNSFSSQMETEIQYILEKVTEKRSLILGTPTRLPTLGYITSDYGIRISPYDNRRKMHEGIDIANRYGADVIAPANGLVQFSGDRSGYGKVIVVDHGNGIETYFAHLSRQFVKSGDKIKRGQRIGAVGSSGHSTGPHVHYEVRANGLPVDPCWYILDQSNVCRSR